MLCSLQTWPAHEQLLPIEQSYTSHNSLVLYPTIHHNINVHLSVLNGVLWDMGYETGALRVLSECQVAR